MGDAFSTETFLTNLSKMSPQARQTLFGRTDLDGVIERVQKFAAVADTRREGGRIFANPSGSAPAAAQIGLGGGIAGGVVAAAAGQPLPLMGALAVPASGKRWCQGDDIAQGVGAGRDPDGHEPRRRGCHGQRGRIRGCRRATPGRDDASA